MVNTRGKIRKTQHPRKTLFSQASITESDHQSTDSGALIASNEDLLTEILLRLPVTSVLRFKSVSKHWLSLLSHRRFTTLYEKISNTPGLFVRGLYIPFDVENKNTPPFRKLDFCNDLKGLRIMQSCNGLLLCCSDLGHQRERKYYVFNPTTKQFAIIPSVPGGTYVRESIHFMGLAYDKEDCVDYKVVCILRAKANGVLRQTAEQDLFQIQIYSSDTGKWKIVKDYFLADCYTSFSCGVYWNGAIHWARGSDPLYFNLEVEQLRKLPLPVTTMYSLFYFGESRGHLHMVVRPVVTPNPENPLHLHVYEMLGDRSGWFLKYQVELDELPFAYPESSHIYLPPSSQGLNVRLARVDNSFCEAEINIRMFFSLTGSVSGYPEIGARTKISVYGLWFLHSHLGLFTKYGDGIKPLAMPTDIL
ncbi:F-box protein-like protein [Tanacetum coccineum]